ncbi:hypothetical protein IDJ75_20245 [Mucilaginibacter rigui]|uniref:Uncharacterized protein n=1 Tax=Mucilaginibacter rigui TaxID=534635 RepID=A0ABR7XAK5_9SPHI|nr:hypothetical protein [Mucilaginibacter rigui]MBD1387627.1 hypothetical protein [Mucilaginibacter rigui]
MKNLIADLHIRLAMFANRSFAIAQDDKVGTSAHLHIRTSAHFTILAAL